MSGAEPRGLRHSGPPRGWARDHRGDVQPTIGRLATLWSSAGYTNSMVNIRKFGDTGLSLSMVGLGAGQIGEADVDEATASGVLNGALDLGVSLIDTAASYGSSEERIGRHLGHRRDEFVLSSKGGQAIDGQPDWSPASVSATPRREQRSAG